MNRAVPKERFNCTTFVYLLRQKIIYSLSPSNRACEQALRGALAAGREKEGELATTSLKFEYLHRKSRCKKLIGGDDISNDVITSAAFLARVFQCLFTFAHIRADWRKSNSSVDGEPQGNWRRNSNSRNVVASSPSFSCPAARAPQKTCSQAASNRM